jgi:hypothetical protein
VVNFHGSVLTVVGDGLMDDGMKESGARNTIEWCYVNGGREVSVFMEYLETDSVLKKRNMSAAGVPLDDGDEPSRESRYVKHVVEDYNNRMIFSKDVSYVNFVFPLCETWVTPPLATSTSVS